MNTSKITATVLLGFTLLFSSALPAQEPSDHTILVGKEDIIRSGEGFASGCLQARKWDKAALADYLKRNYNVTLNEEQAEFDKDLLVYLAAYFQVMQSKFLRPITIYATNEEGPRLVRAGNDSIYFSKNAAAEVFTKKLGEATDNGNQSGVGNIEFSNTLFEQMTRALSDESFVKNVLQKIYGVIVDAPPKGAAYKIQKMTSPELGYILKDFIDLPPSVAQKMHLAHIVRMRAGAKGSQDEVARYDQETQTIQLFDKAFEDGAAGAEDTILHEMGHALWDGMTEEEQEQFSVISWKKDEKGRWDRKASTGDFVGKIAAKNREEDFAEHFAAYVNRPELLKGKASDKYAFFKDAIFPTTEYFTQAHPRAKVYVPSDRPDVKPPWIDIDLNKAVTLSAQVMADKQNLMLSCAVEGLRDDISGVQEVYAHLKGDQGARTALIGDARLIDPKKAKYEVQRKFPLSDFKPGEKLRLGSLTVRDKAGNEEHYYAEEPSSLNFWSKGVPSVSVDGTKRSGPRPKEIEVAWDRVKMAKTGEPGVFDVEVPVPTQDLSALHIQFRHSPWEDLKVTAVRTGLDRKDSKDPSKFKIRFPEKTPPGRLEISGMSLIYRDTPEYEEIYYRPTAPDGLSNLRIELESRKPDLSVPNVDVNQLQLTYKPVPAGERNSEGGDAGIEVKVPLKGLGPQQKARIGFWMRAPDGRRLYDASNVKGTPGTSSMEGEGVTLGFALKANQQKGEYILESIEIEKEYDDEIYYSDNVQVSQSNSVKLIERGIRKTVFVQGYAPGGPRADK